MRGSPALLRGARRSRIAGPTLSRAWQRDRLGSRQCGDPFNRERLPVRARSYGCLASFLTHNIHSFLAPTVESETIAPPRIVLFHRQVSRSCRSSCSCLTQLRSDCSVIPSAAATSLIDRPDLTIATASRRNSGGYGGRDFGMQTILSRLADASAQMATKPAATPGFGDRANASGSSIYKRLEASKSQYIRVRVLSPLLRECGALQGFTASIRTISTRLASSPFVTARS
jgi:hypothetical protein